MTYEDLIRKISRRGEMAQNRALIHKFLEAVKSATWRSGRFEIPDFAVFTVRKAKARTIRNPITHEPMRLPAQRAVKARVSKDWRTR